MPFGVQVAAAWAAAIGLIIGVTLVVVLLLAQVAVVIGAVVGALLLSAILQPVVARLRAAGVPRLVATTMVFVGFLALLVGASWAIGQQVAGQFDDLGAQLADALAGLRAWISETLPISSTQLAQGEQQLTDAVRNNAGGLIGRVTAAFGTVGEVFTATVLALFLTFFMLADGRRLWTWIVGLFPAQARATVDPAGDRAWSALVSYMRGIIVVALADATLVGIALLILGVPFVVPLAVLTFLGAFIPLIGATLAGAAAVLIAVVDQGLGTALVLLVVVLVVQWLDSDLLQPLILSRAVHLHPVAVALAITTGTLLVGIGGAIAATPLVAAVYAMVRPAAHDGTG